MFLSGVFCYATSASRSACGVESSLAVECKAEMDCDMFFSFVLMEASILTAPSKFATLDKTVSSGLSARSIALFAARVSSCDRTGGGNRSTPFSVGADIPMIGCSGAMGNGNHQILTLHSKKNYY